MSEAARSRRDDARYEPQVDVSNRGDLPGGGDPLAELARLVGHDDPFRAVFRPPAVPSHDGQGRGAGNDARGGHADDPHALAHQGWDQGWQQEHEYHAAHPGDAAHGADAYGEHEYAVAHHDDHHHPDPHHADQHYAEAHHADPRHADGHYADGRHADGHHAYADEAYADDAGLADGYLATDAAAAATLPDMWARQGDGHGGQAPALDHGGPSAAPPSLDDGRRSSARRPLAVLAAVLVLTGGGLAASFLVKAPSSSGAASAGQGRSAPTIMAAAGPTKVKVDDAAATAPEDKDAALLNKNPGTSSGPVRIVSSQEQPADLGQLPKTAELAEGARPLPPAAPSPFPEPKRVKTFVVHPDGTMLSADGVPAAPGAGDARSTNRGATTPATPSATTPRTAAATGAPPSVTSQAVAPADALAALAAAPDPAGSGTAAPAKPARQPASPGVRTASAKPNDTAEAPTATGGSFGVQLASSPVEASANAAFAKLKKQYPAQLGPLTASVHKAETGDKPIYRVRVGSMSQDEANALCAQLKGAGGSCFVVHN